MTTSGASYMGCEPGINTSIVKGMGAIIQNAHALILLDRILTDGTIVVHGTRGSDKGSMLMNLIRSRMDGNRLIEKVMKRGGFKHLPDETGKKSVCRGISTHPIAVKKRALRASGS
jgi:hypothetical protein